MFFSVDVGIPISRNDSQRLRLIAQPLSTATAVSSDQHSLACAYLRLRLCHLSYDYSRYYNCAPEIMVNHNPDAFLRRLAFNAATMAERMGQHRPKA